MPLEKIILFDGVCNFCNASVNFIMKRDSKVMFKFAALQSDFAKQHLQGSGVDPDALESVVLIEGSKVYTKSSAALNIAKQLDGLWPMFYVFIIVPTFIRNPIYNFIARNRYKWFGKREQCRIPTAEERSRFVG